MQRNKACLKEKDSKAIGDPELNFTNKESFPYNQLNME